MEDAGPCFRAAEGEGDVAVLTGLIRAAFADVAGRFGLTLENCASHPAFTTADHQRGAMAEGVAYYVLEDEDGPAGCVAWDARVPGEPRLARLGVLPAKRRRGYGRRLVEYVIARARREGVARLLIGVIAEHGELVGWYERLGFTRLEVRRHPELPFEVLVMELRLRGRGEDGTAADERPGAA